MFRALAERAGARMDVYGGGESVKRLESRVAGLLGKEAAVLFPSGTMAQQVALRIWCERSGRWTVGFHPQCHLDVHEERGYEHLHGMHARPIGNRDRLIARADLDEVREPLGALLLELPQRDLGGQLPAGATCAPRRAWARANGVALHLDGARLWQCGPFYRRPLHEIAALFDTVYVSLYKDLGGLGGCVLAGPEDVIAEARVWRVRHGGRLVDVRADGAVGGAWPRRAAAAHAVVRAQGARDRRRARARGRRRRRSRSAAGRDAARPRPRRARAPARRRSTRSRRSGAR